MRRLLSCLGAALLLLGLAATPTAAQAGSLTITNLLCPTSYSGTNFTADCTEPPNPPTMFFVDGPTTADATADTTGVVSFAGLADGTYTVTGGIPGEFADLVISCVRADSDWPVQQDGVIVTIEIPADAEISCMWWNIPMDLSGKQPPSTAVPAPGNPAADVLFVIGGMLLLVVALVAARRSAQPR